MRTRSDPQKAIGKRKPCFRASRSAASVPSLSSRLFRLSRLPRPARFGVSRRWRNAALENFGCWPCRRRAGVSRGPTVRLVPSIRVAAEAAILLGGIGWAVVGGEPVLVDGDGDVVMHEAGLFAPGL